MQRDVTTYDSWELRPPTLPARSRLFHLEPMVVGTPMVESLTGYIARLAEAHCVSTAILYARELAPAVDKPYLMSGGPRSRDYGLSLRTTGRLVIPRINGISPFASDMVAALEGLTLCRDLRFLTMLAWKGVLAGRHLLRTERAWCSLCYEQWRRDDKPIYEPLLWALSAAEVCIDHQVLLATQCPSCRKEMLPLARQSRPGFCSRCSCWLGSVDASKKQPPATDLEFQTWKAKSVGELLAAVPYLGEEPRKEKIALALSSCAAQVTSGNMAAFGRLIRKQKNVLWGWDKGGLRIPIDDLLNLCHRIQITPLEFLTADEVVVDPAVAAVAGHGESRPVSRRPRCAKPYDEEKTRRQLELILVAEPPISMREASRRIGHSGRWLYMCFPELCRAISARHAAYQKEACEKERNRRREEIRRAALRLHAEGIYPTQPKIAALLKKPGGIYSDFADAVLKDVREELGLKQV